MFAVILFPDNSSVRRVIIANTTDKLEKRVKDILPEAIVNINKGHSTIGSVRWEDKVFPICRDNDYSL